MRVVLDTNIWISGLLMPNSNAGIVIKKWQTSRFDVVVSSYILQEIGRVLAYPKIRKRLHWDDEKIKHYLDLLSFFAEIAVVDEVAAHVESDPKDSLILSTLVKSDADFLISGDADLLSLKNDYSILTVTEFLRKLEGF